VITKCPNCGGNLKIKNPDSAKTVLCSYCNSQVDLKRETAKPAEFGSKDLHKPKSALSIGAEGSLRGVKYQVVGRIRYKDLKSHRWDEWLLLSEDGQYLWLQEEDWEFMSMRKFTPAEPFDPREVGDTLTVEGYHLEVEGKCKAIIEYFEGELTWQAEIGETVNYLDAWRGEDSCYSVEWTDREITYFVGYMIPAGEIYSGFKLGQLPSEALDDDEYYQETWLQKTMSKLIGSFEYKLTLTVGIIMAFTALILGFVGGNSIPNLTGTEKTSTGEVMAGTYNLSSKNRVYHLKSEVVGLNNANLTLEFSVLNEKGDVVEQFEDFYWAQSGLDGGESWSQRETVRNKFFSVKEPGKYSFKVVPLEKNVVWDGVNLAVKQGVFHTAPLWTVTLLTLAYPFFVTFFWMLAYSSVKPPDDDD
jgi:hypothetical protein